MGQLSGPTDPSADAHWHNRAERKDQEPPARVAGEHLRREQEHAEDASLCQHA